MADSAAEGGGSSAWLPTVEGFTLVRRIGSGGYSTVFEAIQDDIHAPVALKILEGAYDARGRSRFERECQSMGRLRDERGVVSVYRATYTSDQHPVIVMAYLPGGSLADRVKAAGPMSVEEVLAIAREICAALTAAHESGIYHRDIKPENILLDRFGRAALTDFGIATLAGEVTSTETASSLTPAHAPPERYLTDVEVGDPVHGDIYSLSSTLYSLLSGTPPHGTVREGGIAALIDRILEEPPAPLTRTDVPAHVVAALTRGLSKNPSDRFDTAAQLLAALEPPLIAPPPPSAAFVAPLIVATVATVATPATATEGESDDLDRTRRRESLPPIDPPVVAPACDEVPPPRIVSPSSEVPTTKRPRVFLALAIGLVVVAGSVGGAWFAFGSDDGPCAAGTNWTQKVSTVEDGTPIGLADQSHVALAQAGTSFGFQSADEYRRFGFAAVPPREISSAQFYDIDRRPKDGILFKTRSDDPDPDLYFYSEAGTFFPVQDLRSLAGVGKSAADAILVPHGIVDKAADVRNVPKAGTLIRIAGTDTTWLIDGASRRPAPRLCGGAKFVTLPNDPHILDGIASFYGDK